MKQTIREFLGSIQTRPYVVFGKSDFVFSPINRIDYMV